ncbi:MAG: DUF952 domain-containing protein [Nakamurella sp.]
MTPPSAARGDAQSIDAAPLTQLVYHVALAADWVAAQSVGEYRISTLGRTLDEQGFIHGSFGRQVAGVLTAFYAGIADPLVLLLLNAASLPIVVEPAAAGSESVSPGAELFPHIYGAIPVDAVLDVQPLLRNPDESIVLPDL